MQTGGNWIPRSKSTGLEHEIVMIHNDCLPFSISNQPLILLLSLWKRCYSCRENCLRTVFLFVAACQHSCFNTQMVFHEPGCPTVQNAIIVSSQLVFECSSWIRFIGISFPVGWWDFLLKCGAG